MADPKTSVTLEHVISRGDEQVSTIVDGAVVLMNVGTGQYFKLDDIGSRIWEMIESPQPVRAVCNRLAEEYQVESAQCESDVLKLLNNLHEKNLIGLADPA